MALDGDRWMMTWEELRRKQSSSNQDNFLRMFLDELRKTTQTPVRTVDFPARIREHHLPVESLRRYFWPHVPACSVSSLSDVFCPVTHGWHRCILGRHCSALNFPALVRLVASWAVVSRPILSLLVVLYRLLSCRVFPCCFVSSHALSCFSLMLCVVSCPYFLCCLLSFPVLSCLSLLFCDVSCSVLSFPIDLCRLLSCLSLRFCAFSCKPQSSPFSVFMHQP